MTFSTSRYLATRARFGIKLGLDPMRRLLEALGDPHRAAPALLIGGTNGKGSVVAYVDAALRASGLRVGRYVSPHLVRVNERIAVDSREISDASLRRHLEQIDRTARRLVARGVLEAHPTHFEVLTAAAFLHFRARRVDVMVLEVGLGGRGDATNVVDPAASAIVSIDRDHEAHLGKTIPAIAREKAGILRRGTSTVVGPLRASARRAIEKEAARLGARLVAAGRVAERNASGVSIETANRRYAGVRPLPGRHQEQNAGVALSLVEEARRAGIAVALDKAGDAIAATVWPGRLQEIPGSPSLLLDGAHNPAAARALASHLRRYYGSYVLVFGMMADKDVAAAARALFPAARVVILTPLRMKRAASPDLIRRQAGRSARHAFETRGVGEALRLARKIARRGEVVVVSGSLYLVGNVLRRTIC